MGVVIARWTVEGPIASGNTRVIDDSDGTVKDVEGEPVQPSVPVTLIELIAGVRMTEEACTLAHLHGYVWHWIR